MTDILVTITNLNSDINYWYRDSKLPKFIKNAIANSNRKRLKSKVDKLLEKPYLPSGILYEYFLTLKDYYPPNGKFGNCLKVNGNPPVMSFIITIREAENDTERLMVNVQFPEPFIREADVVIVSYSFVKNGTVISKWSDTSKKTEPYIVADVGDHNSTAKALRELFIETVKGDIKQHLYNIIERSERIN